MPKKSVPVFLRPKWTQKSENYCCNFSREKYGKLSWFTLKTRFFSLTILLTSVFRDWYRTLLAHDYPGTGVCWYLIAMTMVLSLGSLTLKIRPIFYDHFEPIFFWILRWVGGCDGVGWDDDDENTMARAIPAHTRRGTRPYQHTTIPVLSGGTWSSRYTALPYFLRTKLQQYFLDFLCSFWS